MLPKNYRADAKRRRRKGGGGGGDGGWEMTNKIRNKTERSDRSVCLSVGTRDGRKDARKMNAKEEGREREEHAIKILGPKLHLF